MSQDRKTRLFTGLLLVVASVIFLVTLNIYVDKEIEKSEKLIALNIEKIMNEYPTASGDEEDMDYESESEPDEEIILE